MAEYKPPTRAKVSKLVDILKELDQPLSETAIRNHIKKAGLKQSKRDGTYTTSAVLRAIAKHQKNDNRIKGGELGDELKKLQIKKLEIEIGRLEGSVIPIDEHLREIRELMAHVRATYDHFLSGVGAFTKDAKITGLAERLCDTTIEFFNQRLEEETE